MSFWPNSLATWTQTVGPIVTGAGLAVAWYANWRQARNRTEDLERSQLEAARLVAAVAGEDPTAHLIEEAVIRNNGPLSILDVHVWFEKHSDGKPIMLADTPNDGNPAWYVFRRFIAAHDDFTWRRFSAKLPEKKPMLGQADFMVAWTSGDGIHWLLKNSAELHREPPARYISPETLTGNQFRPNVEHQDPFLDQP